MRDLSSRVWRTRRSTRGVVLVVALSLLTLACGSHHSHEELVAAAQVQSATGSGSSSGDLASGTPGDATGTVGETAGAAGPSASGGSAGQSATGASRPGAAPGRAGTASAGVVAGSRPDIVIGSVGPLSGLVGTTLAPGVDGARVWVRWINDHGGLNGSRVVYIPVDDQSDPARHRALTQELVEDRGAKAFLMNGEALSGAGTVSYIQQKRIPVIGSEGGNQYWYENSMYFPQFSHGDHLVMHQLGATAEWGVANKKTKLGILTCQEAKVCADGIRLTRAHGAKLGMEVVYSTQVSLAKPELTGECLGARDAGAQVFTVAGDANFVSRLAAACARQNYFPTYSVSSTIAAPQHLRDKNIKQMIVSSPAAPFFLDDVAAVREFQQAMRTYAPGVEATVGHMTGWVAGKLLERASKNLAAPTTEAILQGLWTVKADDLGGLTYPLTFTRDSTAARATCWWVVFAENGKYSAPFGGARKCTDIVP